MNAPYVSIMITDFGERSISGLVGSAKSSSFFRFRKLTAIILIALLSILLGLFHVKSVCAATSTDNVNGIYTDDFANFSGTSSHNNTEIIDGKLVLTKSGSDYNTSGYVILKVVRPLSVSKWNSVDISQTAPDGTSVKVQVYDDSNNIFADIYLVGNSTGISSFPADLSNVPVLQCADQYLPGIYDQATEYNYCNKPQALILKITLTTTDITKTPEIDSLTFDWTVKDGNLSDSTMSNSAWHADNGNMQNTNQSLYSNTSIYPAFKWVSSQYVGDYSIDKIYVLQNDLFGWTSYDVGRMFAMNKNTGQENWQFPFVRCSGPGGFITQSGIFYGTEYGCDLAYAIDTSDGKIKWSYNFLGGHGNNRMTLSGNLVYTERHETTGADIILYEFYQNGILKSANHYPAPNVSSSEGMGISPMAVGNDGTLYFLYSTYNVSDYSNTNHGMLRAIDPINATIKWAYPIDDSNPSQAPLIGPDGTIYVSANTGKLFAILPDGSLKWQTSLESGSYVYAIALKDSEHLWVNSCNNEEYCSVIMDINIDDGSIVWSKSNIDSYGMVSTNDGGLYFVDDNWDDSASQLARLNYYDYEHNLKWQIPYIYDSQDGKTWFDFTSPALDERGWLYSGLEKSSDSGDPDYYPNPTNSFGQIFALAPWSLSVSNNTANYHSGDTITFTTTSSMLSTNPLFGGDNQIQIIMDNNDKIPLTYSSTNSDGDSVWTGTYTLPSDITDGTHSYTVEASQPYVQTDIATHFASASTQSNNTGITLTGSFAVTTPEVIAPPSSGGGGLPPAAYNFPNPPLDGFKVLINNGATQTDNRIVSLSFNAGADVQNMAISMTEDFAGAGQETYSPTKQWDLCSNFIGFVKSPTCPDGIYKVYVQFYTYYGRTSDIASSSIILKSRNASVENLQNTINQPIAKPNMPFTKYLYYKQVDSDVKLLQVFLNSNPETQLTVSGIGSSGKETNYFGLLTKLAVIKFQEKYAQDILSPLGLIKGTGYVGKATLTKLNELMGNK